MKAVVKYLMTCCHLQQHRSPRPRGHPTTPSISTVTSIMPRSLEVSGYSWPTTMYVCCRRPRPPEIWWCMDETLCWNQSNACPLWHTVFGTICCLVVNLLQDHQRLIVIQTLSWSVWPFSPRVILSPPPRIPTSYTKSSITTCLGWTVTSSVQRES